MKRCGQEKQPKTCTRSAPRAAAGAGEGGQIARCGGCWRNLARGVRAEFLQVGGDVLRPAHGRGRLQHHDIVVFLAAQHFPANRGAGLRHFHLPYEVVTGPFIGDWWQAARPLGSYALAGCNVAPGFDFADFSFLRDDESLAQRLAAIDPPAAAYL